MASVTTEDNNHPRPADASNPAQAKKKAKKKKKKKEKSNASPAKKRLMRDFKQMMNDKSDTGVSAAPVDANIFQWQAIMFGPSDTEWEGGTFQLLMDFTEEYPNKPPSVKFVTKMFHPNVSFCKDVKCICCTHSEQQYKVNYSEH
jgi:ubiquitin-protein ligase